MGKGGGLKLDRQLCSHLVEELLITNRMEERAAKLIAFCEHHFPKIFSNWDNTFSNNLEE